LGFTWMTWLDRDGKPLPIPPPPGRLVPRLDPDIPERDVPDLPGTALLDR